MGEGEEGIDMIRSDSQRYGFLSWRYGRAVRLPEYSYIYDYDAEAQAVETIAMYGSISGGDSVEPRHPHALLSHWEGTPVKGWEDEEEKTNARKVVIDERHKRSEERRLARRREKYHSKQAEKREVLARHTWKVGLSTAFGVMAAIYDKEVWRKRREMQHAAIEKERKGEPMTIGDRRLAGWSV